MVKGKFCELCKVFWGVEGNATGASRLQAFSPGPEEGTAGIEKYLCKGLEHARAGTQRFRRESGDR